MCGAPRGKKSKTSAPFEVGIVPFFRVYSCGPDRDRLVERESVGPEDYAPPRRSMVLFLFLLLLGTRARASLPA